MTNDELKRLIAFRGGITVREAARIMKVRKQPRRVIPDYMNKAIAEGVRNG